MPQMNNAEIEAGIRSGTILGLAIDTSIFDRFGCDLKHHRLLPLQQLAGSKLQLLLPEVVAREIVDHISRRALESRASLVKALTDFRRYWQTDEPKDPPLQDSYVEAQKQVDQFLALTDGKQISLSGAKNLAAEASDLYFACKPPFEQREQKKYEFPDALALLSLEALAERRNKEILCVSADKGWQSYCAGSARLICVEELETALACINSSGRARAEGVWRLLRERGKNHFFYEPIRAAFRARFRVLDFVPEIQSTFEYEAKPELEDLDEIDFKTAGEPVVVEADAESVTFVFKVKARVIFIADFSFYASHTVQDEGMEFAAARRDVARTIEYEVLLTVTRDEHVLGEVRQVFVDRPKLRVDFGVIDPFNP